MVRIARAGVVLLLMLGGVQMASAQGNGNGNGPPEHSNAGGNGNNGNGDDAPEHSNAGGNGNGEDNGDGNAGPTETTGNNGNGNGGSSGSIDSVLGAVSPGAAAAPAQSESDGSERTALDALQSGRAVALETILPNLEAQTGGQMIDAKLMTVEGFLLYAIKVLTPQGRVETRYYYAQSGLPVRGQ